MKRYYFMSIRCLNNSGGSAETAGTIEDDEEIEDPIRVHDLIFKELEEKIKGVGFKIKTTVVVSFNII